MDVLKATDKRSCLIQYQQHHRSQSFPKIQKYVSITRFNIFVLGHFLRHIGLFSLIVILVSFHANINVFLLYLMVNMLRLSFYVSDTEILALFYILPICNKKSFICL